MNADWIIVVLLAIMLLQYERDSRYLRTIAKCVCKIAGQPFPASVTISQLSMLPAPDSGKVATSNALSAGGLFHRSFMAITGVPVGGSGTFTETPVPAGSAFPAGTAMLWASSDPLLTLVPSADGTSVVATLDPSAIVGGSATLTFTGTSGSQSATGSVTVPYLSAVIPFPTSVTINQVA